MKFVGFKMIFIIALSLMGSVVNSEETSDFKLPTNFKPVNYELNVTTHLDDKFMFEGVVCIRMTCVGATDTIVLHSTSLNIDTKSVVVANGDGNVIPVGSVSFDTDKEFMNVKSTVNFKPCDEYLLTIPFTGNLTDDVAGYCRRSYVDTESNQTRWLAITYFEPLGARRAFPCWDEPGYKATFKIRLSHKKGLTSMSNMKFMNQINCPSNSDYVVDEFEESPPMSTYLVVYMVSDLVYIEANSENDQVKYGIICRKELANQTEFAINFGPKVLKYHEDYFDEKFPLKKQDMASIPDFSTGSMENWGLVILKDGNLLFDPDVTITNDVYDIAKNTAHELAHQWFGDLVTMKWWTGLWLNEGFAVYAGLRGVDFLFPDSKFFQVKNVENFLLVLDFDSDQAADPLSVAIEKPDDIAPISADPITFAKGPILLHMMNTLLGENTFKQGIRNYIHKYKFSNAEQDDLWCLLTEEAHRQGTLDKNLTVKQIMDPWIFQPGYPVLNVVRDYSAGTVTLTQERYLSIKSNGTDNKTCWWIPITMTTSGDLNQTNATFWLNCENNSLTIPLANDNEWVIYNMQMTVLFRVSYDTRNWMGIICTLNDPTKYETIPTLNRVQLILDSLGFSKAGDMDYEITFQLLKYLRNEKEYSPWFAALTEWRKIDYLLMRTPKHAVFQNNMRDMLSCVYSKFRNLDEKVNGYENINFKRLVISRACEYQTKDCIQRVLDLFRKWIKSVDPDNNNILPKDLKININCYAMKYGGEEEWNFLWKRFQRSNFRFDKIDMIFALGCSSTKSLILRYLNWSLDESIIPRGYASAVLDSVKLNEVGFLVAKEFLYCKIADIYEYDERKGDSLVGYVNNIASQMKTKEELKELQSFIIKSSSYFKEPNSVINQITETIKKNIEWTSKFYNKIVPY
ncbi:aminopeptidase N isoform X1 [Acyrthosiphon pisum]|uniref:Aminopeptidase n=1 Tax=Acyrthosiphon pisum TaxID=7029 RepID=A0A8R2FAC4_ACYPI|nr:aminopeptidase N isoform X1 [Acyrthosiphon pisum]XP_008183588.1 aminopeptidase N isoform X1 [Acyrthosiphon pisum]XP_029344974.1 aminopeptidase N isoform X1 [Acyrthosiphon pisum]|eukprot:XP_003240500.1 PREDICTED: aminopeptidase N isoform X1 [Acyrthosiphon pisum]